MKNRPLADKIILILCCLSFVGVFVYYAATGTVAEDGLVVSLLASALFAALVYALLRWIKKKFLPQKRAAREKSHALSGGSLELPVVGVNYYLDNLASLVSEGADYKRSAAQIIKAGHAGKRLFQYYYPSEPVRVVPEPQNKLDKNAMYIELAGKKVGYIARTDTDTVRSILRDNPQAELSAFVGGGKYKVVSLDGDVETMENTLHITLKITL